ncbi:hypothetical protein CR513_58929, partial [Mucuna pruriens]
MALKWSKRIRDFVSLLRGRKEPVPDLHRQQGPLRRGYVKAQILVDFIVELTPTREVEQPSKGWTLSVDGASNQRGSRARVILEGLDEVLIEQSLRFEFKASNNQAEYEALLARMRLA